jgi:hypothetical protein
VVAVIPPLALLAAVHGVSVLLRAHAGARGTHLIATAMTAFIATGAFWLSFTALRSLAITAGAPHGEAWLWPLIIEGSMDHPGFVRDRWIWRGSTVWQARGSTRLS